MSWIVAMAAVWLAAAGQPWVLTLLIFGVGTLYVCAPPSGGIPLSLLLLFFLLLLLAGTAFLPAPWFGTAFRQPFLDHGIDLPGTFSLQPWLSLEDFLLLVTSLLWAWSCFETKLTYSQREFLVGGFLLGLGLVALSTIMSGTVVEGKLPLLVRGVGRFENRNQTGDLLMMGGIFSFARGLTGVSRRQWRALLWFVLTGVFMVAVIRNGSRAAVGLFGLGLLLLVAVLRMSRRKNGDGGLLFLAIVTMVGLVVFSMLNSHLLDRFRILVSGNQEGRLPIYEDVISMVGRSPWCGVGLGNFEGVFNVERVESVQLPARCVHPDSDWLWLASELSVPGVILVAALVAVMFRLYMWKTPFPSLTSPAVTVAFLFLVHTFFDVGGHRIGTLWCCLYLVGLGVCRQKSLTAIQVPSFVLRLTGLFLLVVAVLRIQSASTHPWMPTRASVIQMEDFTLPNTPLAEQKSILDENLRWAPLDWTLYYQRAVVRRQAGDPVESSDEDFNRALFLEQSSTSLPVAIGEVCRFSDPAEALVAWKELLQRAGARREEFYQNLYAYPGLEAKTRLELVDLAGDDPNLQVMAVINQQPSEFNWMLDNFLTANPTLKGVNPQLARKLFDRWAEVGDQGALIQQWPLHSEWCDAGWRSYAKALASAGRYQEAVALVFQQLPAPPMPDFRGHESTDAATQLYRANPQDAFAGMKLYLAQMAEGSNDAALNTLQSVAQLPVKPAYIQYLLAQSLAKVDQNEAAWRALEPLVDRP